MIPSTRSPPDGPPRDEATLASPPTVCRLENRVAEVLLKHFNATDRTSPEYLILDFDATDDPVSGQQERRFFHRY